MKTMKELNINEMEKVNGGFTTIVEPDMDTILNASIPEFDDLFPGRLGIRV